MTSLDNKDKLLAAIEDYPLLTKNPKKLLKILSMFDQPVAAESLMQTSSLPKQVVYPALTKLLKAELINRLKHTNSSYYLFEVNKTKLFEVLDLYSKTQAIKSQI